MNRILLALSALFLSVNAASAAPYTFTPDDYIEYGIYFSAGPRVRAGKLLTVRYGNITGYYANFFPSIKEIPTQRQSLRLRTPRGSVIVNRDDNVGLSVTRDTHNEKKRIGTKRLDVTFENATCIDAARVSSPCSVALVLTTDGIDVGASRTRRVLTITTSTGLSFTYRTRPRKAGTPYTAADLRAPVVSNYALEWRPSVEAR
jgi:hypothetical protein